MGETLHFLRRFQIYHRHLRSCTVQLHKKRAGRAYARRKDADLQMERERGDHIHRGDCQAWFASPCSWPLLYLSPLLSIVCFKSTMSIPFLIALPSMCHVPPLPVTRYPLLLVTCFPLPKSLVLPLPTQLSPSLPPSLSLLLSPYSLFHSSFLSPRNSLYLTSFVCHLLYLPSQGGGTYISLQNL